MTDFAVTVCAVFYTYAEDYRLWSIVARNQGVFYVIPEFLTKYRISENQISHIKQKEQILTTYKIKNEILEYLLNSINEDIDIESLSNSLIALNQRGIIEASTINNLFYNIFKKNGLY